MTPALGKASPFVGVPARGPGSRSARTVAARTSTAMNTSGSARPPTMPTPHFWIMAPVAAPSSPPALHAAWNDDMIGDFHFVSMVLACPFIDTSSAPFAAPSARSTKHSNGKFGTSAGNGSATTNVAPRTAVARPLPNRGASRPASGIATMAPSAKANSAIPSEVSLSDRLSLMRGISTAQAPIPNPLARNTARVAIRSLTGLMTTRPSRCRRLLRVWFAGPRTDRTQRSDSRSRRPERRRTAPRSSTSPTSWRWRPDRLPAPWPV